ncbi:MAG TPA: acetyl-coenzyme A synthetase N-terminal domain-containing protein, partial [Candidatus Nanopelagicales bacterium]|nr:acetyl-coenzyme A synthetase N-terminal domain-containing protein [Candidatus Nanopelagicales bacterium]
MMTQTLANLATESRSFPPPEQFAAQAVATAELYDEAAADRLGFWAQQAQRLAWSTPWTEV